MALGRLGATEAGPMIREALRSPASPSWIFPFAEALALLGSPEGVPALHDVLVNSSFLREAASAASTDTAGAPDPHIEASAVRAAIQALGRLRAEVAIAPLLKLTQCGHAELRQAALTSLWEISESFPLEPAPQRV